MFQVTEKANEMIKDHLKDQEELPSIRVFLNPGGWGGPSLGMALDEPKEDDDTFDNDGLTFVMNSQLFQDVKPVTIDYVTSPMGAGFRISSNMALGGCGQSGKTGSPCSC